MPPPHQGMANRPRTLDDASILLPKLQTYFVNIDCDVKCDERQNIKTPGEANPPVYSTI